jgi:hypothetical protein
MLYQFGTEATVRFAQALFPIEEEQLLRVNRLNVLGVLLTTLVFSKFWRQRSAPTASELLRDQPATKRAIRMLLIVGLGATYLVILPYELGFSTFVLPGVIYNLRVFVYIAIMLLSFLYAREKGPRKEIGILLVTVLALHIIPNLLTFAKLPVLLALGSAAGGWLLARPRPKVLFGSAGLLIASYMLLVPYITVARELLGRRAAGVAVEERAAYARESGGDYGGIAGDLQQAWWSRLNYVPYQAFALEEYENGRPGESFQSIWYTFVPRILFPNKPVVTRIANEFNKMVVGSDQSASSPTVFAEAYWNGGWFAFVGLCFYLGWMFAAVTNATLERLVKGDLRWLPGVYFGAFMGIRVDAWFVETYVGSLMLAGVYGVLLHILLGAPRVAPSRSSFEVSVPIPS